MFYIGKQFRKNTSPFSENGKKNSMYNTFETNFVCNAHKRIYFVTATMELFTEEKLLNCTFFLILEPFVCVFGKTYANEKETLP